MSAQAWMCWTWMAAGTVGFGLAFVMRRQAQRDLGIANAVHRATKQEGEELLARALAVQDRLNRSRHEVEVGRMIVAETGHACGRCRAPLAEVIDVVCMGCLGRGADA